nr:MAG TPA: hypothetical protein [Caudoviricetes sp.]
MRATSQCGLHRHGLFSIFLQFHEIFFLIFFDLEHNVRIFDVV